MKVTEHSNKTEIIAEGSEDFLPTCQHAINIAARRKVPSHFRFKGYKLVLRGNESVVDLYTDYLKTGKPLSINSPISDLVKLPTIEGGLHNGDEVQNNQRNHQKKV